MIDLKPVVEPRVAPGDMALATQQIRRCVGPSEFAARFEDLIVDGSAALNRTHRPGHLTGSAFVVSADRTRCLMMFHTKLQRWLQPGGHADGDGNLANVALREASEETGIDGLQVFEPAIDLDVHEVDPPAEDSHLHFDVRFLVLALPDVVLVGNHESEALRWVAFDDLAELGVDDGLLRMVRVSRGALRQLR